MDIKLPKLGEGIEKATVSYWYKKTGDAVSENEDLVEMVTDKSTFNMPSPLSGVVKKLLAEEGAEIKVGQTIAIIE